MTKEEVHSLLATVLDPEASPLDPPEERHWHQLRESLGMDFPAEYVFFIESMAELSFPGDILNVRTDGRTNGNDGVLLTYEHERAWGRWPVEMIPFYGIGNGDYFAFKRDEGASSAVYYVSHDGDRPERDAASFEDWLRGLPEFLK
ncbi:MAG: SMI1/KNR4 family protein [Acidobacteriota bacterium]